MYQITGNTVSFRVNDSERQQLNDIAITLQTNENQTFTNGKQLVFALLSHCNQLQTELNTNVNTEDSTIPENEIQETIENNEFTNESDLNTENKAIEFKQQLIAAIGYEEIPSDEQLYSDLLEIINMEPDPNELPVKEIEVIKEVEKPLGENEILVDLTANQHELLQKIARWRGQTKRDEQTLPISKLIKMMVFNEGTLTNDHGYFETGLSSKKINS